ncbi:hypothetical protein HGM15179_014501 [Zosterops borbonicus]|uniref:Uncharacterized protein n=1 Tax=Zosterops borbonicus TaxID=364589 RepID=A0A8K1G6E6_9PASS|nr:hypothetical protein HGM15179_014501 [Zosterops borbonicus]
MPGTLRDLPDNRWDAAPELGLVVCIFDYSENAYYDHAILNVALGATCFVLVIDEKTVIKDFSFKNFTAIVCNDALNMESLTPNLYY